MTEKSRKAPLRFFFLNGALHRRVSVDRPADTMVAWHFEEGALKRYSYIDVLRRYEKAYSLLDVCKLLDRSKDVMYIWMNKGMVPPTHNAYKIPNPHPDKPVSMRFWSEDEILEIHDMIIEGSDKSIDRYERTTKSGRGNLPTRRELLAMMHDNEVLYIKEGDQFVPSFRAQDLF